MATTTVWLHVYPDTRLETRALSTGTGGPFGIVQIDEVSVTISLPSDCDRLIEAVQKVRDHLTAAKPEEVPA